MSGMARWWTEMVELVKSLPRSIRTGGRLGRIFRRRDRGQLEEALHDALGLANELLAAPRFIDKPNAIVAASTADEIAVRLGRPEDARDVLERALQLIERELADTSAGPRSTDYRSALHSHARRFRERLRPDH